MNVWNLRGDIGWNPSWDLEGFLIDNLREDRRRSNVYVFFDETQPRVWVKQREEIDCSVAVSEGKGLNREFIQVSESRCNVRWIRECRCKYYGYECLITEARAIIRFGSLSNDYDGDLCKRSVNQPGLSRAQEVAIKIPSPITGLCQPSRDQKPHNRRSKELKHRRISSQTRARWAVKMTNLCVYFGLFLAVFAASGSAHLNLYLNQLEVMRLLGMFISTQQLCPSFQLGTTRNTL